MFAHPAVQLHDGLQTRIPACAEQERESGSGRQCADAGIKLGSRSGLRTSAAEIGNGAFIQDQDTGMQIVQD